MRRSNCQELLLGVALDHVKLNLNGCIDWMSAPGSRPGTNGGFVEAQYVWMSFMAGLLYRSNASLTCIACVLV